MTHESSQLKINHVWSLGAYCMPMYVTDEKKLSFLASSFHRRPVFVCSHYLFFVAFVFVIRSRSKKMKK